jgi:thymidylate kinase
MKKKNYAHIEKERERAEKIEEKTRYFIDRHMSKYRRMFREMILSIDGNKMFRNVHSYVVIQYIDYSNFNHIGSV